MHGVEMVVGWDMVMEMGERAGGGFDAVAFCWGRGPQDLPWMAR